MFILTGEKNGKELRPISAVICTLAASIAEKCSERVQSI